jgi:hypothetical protein
VHERERKKNMEKERKTTKETKLRKKKEKPITFIRILKKRDIFFLQLIITGTFLNIICFKRLNKAFIKFE